jgi:UDP:flavonoid glycosyltransferase YjiC (YdhE family)
VPLAVFPLMFDQLLNASRVAELGLGLQLTPADSTQPKVLRDLVERLDTDAGYRERVSEFRTALQEAGGPRRAADALQQYVAARRGQAAS